MKYRNLFPIIAVCLAVAACGGGGSGAPPVAVTPPPPAPPPPPPTSSSTEREISPQLTDAALTANLSPHVAINPDPAVAAKNRLFVMLPGTGAVPRFYRFILRTGAPRGYHAIGLTYPNDTTIELLCSNSLLPDCIGQTRNEVITGTDTSPVVNIDRANSITGRLISLLTYLATTFPNEGWGQYLVSGQPNWPAITVGGHSQGSGHAGYFAKLQSLDRTVMFSGPGDIGNAGGGPAPWLSMPNVTPASRQYGFTHVSDGLIPVALALRNWDLIGLAAFGAAVSVESASAPFGDSRKLTTSAAPNPAAAGLTPDLPHASTVVDVATPLTAVGTPLYAPVWIHLAFPN